MNEHYKRGMFEFIQSGCICINQSNSMNGKFNKVSRNRFLNFLQNPHFILGKVLQCNITVEVLVHTNHTLGCLIGMDH